MLPANNGIPQYHGEMKRMKTQHTKIYGKKNYRKSEQKNVLLR